MSENVWRLAKIENLQWRKQQKENNGRHAAGEMGGENASAQRNESIMATKSKQKYRRQLSAKAEKLSAKIEKRISRRMNIERRQKSIENVANNRKRKA